MFQHVKQCIFVSETTELDEAGFIVLFVVQHLRFPITQQGFAKGWASLKRKCKGQEICFLTLRLLVE